jgi:hypothetical protein
MSTVIQPTDLIMTLLTHILAQTVRRAIAVTVPTEARSFGPWLIFGSPVPAGGAVEAILVEKELSIYLRSCDCDD